MFDVVSSSVDMPNLCLIKSKRSVVIPKRGVDLSIISKGSEVMSKCGVDLSEHCLIMSKVVWLCRNVVLTCLNIALLCQKVMCYVYM